MNIYTFWIVSCSVILLTVFWIGFCPKTNLFMRFIASNLLYCFLSDRIHCINWKGFHVSPETCKCIILYIFQFEMTIEVLLKIKSFDWVSPQHNGSNLIDFMGVAIQQLFTVTPAYGPRDTRWGPITPLAATTLSNNKQTTSPSQQTTPIRTGASESLYLSSPVDWNPFAWWQLQPLIQLKPILSSSYP